MDMETKIFIKLKSKNYMRNELWKLAKKYAEESMKIEYVDYGRNVEASFQLNGVYSKNSLLRKLFELDKDVKREEFMNKTEIELTVV